MHTPVEMRKFFVNRRVRYNEFMKDLSTAQAPAVSHQRSGPVGKRSNPVDRRGAACGISVAILRTDGGVRPGTGDKLASALSVLGVNFLLGGTHEKESLHEQPARLIAELAKSNEARLRLALIPLFLKYPEFAAHVRKTATSLNKTACTTLQCYYSAAVCLQQKYRSR